MPKIIICTEAIAEAIKRDYPANRVDEERFGPAVAAFHGIEIRTMHESHFEAFKTKAGRPANCLIIDTKDIKLYTPYPENLYPWGFDPIGILGDEPEPAKRSWIKRLWNWLWQGIGRKNDDTQMPR